MSFNYHFFKVFQPIYLNFETFFVDLELAVLLAVTRRLGHKKKMHRAVQNTIPSQKTNEIPDLSVDPVVKLVRQVRYYIYVNISSANCAVIVCGQIPNGLCTLSC